MTHTPEIVMPDENMRQQMPFWNAEMDGLVDAIRAGYEKENPLLSLQWGERISLSAVTEVALKKLAAQVDSIPAPTWERYIHRYKKLRSIKVPAANNKKTGKQEPKRLTINLCDVCGDAIERIGQTLERMGDWKGARLKRDIFERDEINREIKHFIREAYNVPLIITVAFQYAAETYKA